MHPLYPPPSPSPEDTSLNAREAGTIRGGAVTSELPADESVNGSGLVLQWSQSVQSVLDQPPSSLPRNLILGGLIFCCTFGVWAWHGQVQQVSRAEGRLIPKGEVYKVQSRVQGEVISLSVKEGQRVTKGQVIAKLDDQLAKGEVERLQEQLSNYRLQLLQSQEMMYRLQSEAQNKQAIAQAEIESQRAAMQQAVTMASTQQQLVNQLQTEQRAYERRLNRLRPLLSAGAIAEEHLFEVEQAVRDRQQAMTRSQGELSNALQEADRLQAELTKYQAEARQRKLEAEQRLQQLKLEVTQIQANIQESESLLRAARTRQQDMVLQASTSGTISTLHLHNIGEVADAGETIAEIAPDGAPLVLSAALPNSEAGSVRLGMPVQLRFDAFPYQDYGIVSGKVLSISPDVVIDERLGAVYRVEIGLDRTQINRDQQTFQLKAGQTASAEILIQKQRIIDVLLEPFRKLQKGNLNL